MPLTLTRTIDASVEPVTVEEMRVHLRWTDTAEDAAISSWIKAARRRIEDVTGRAFINQTWRLKLDYFPGVIHVPRAPWGSLTKFEYVDQDGDTQTVTATDYTIDSSSEPARIYEAKDKTWPTTWSEPLAVSLTYVAGYGATADDVPEEIKVAIKMLAGHYFRHREAITTGTIVNTISEGLDALIAPYMVFLPGA